MTRREIARHAKEWCSLVVAFTVAGFFAGVGHALINRVL